jgi:penicillin-binding protein 1A
LILTWVLAAVLVGSGSFVAGVLSAPVDFAAPAAPQSALLYDDHGRLFATIRSPEIREIVPADRIPTVMRQAIVAAEDQRFYHNAGVDPLALIRAFWNDITGHPVQGGSTITQQYVKNVYTNGQRTPLRKLREAILAIRLGQHLSKREILTRYLNTLYLGNGTYGVQAAAKFYFGVPVSELDLDVRTGVRSPTLALARAALLAGLAPAPSDWNPVHNPNAARARQLYTLNRMVANDMISAGQASAAYALGMPHLVDKAAPEYPTIAPEFRDQVRDQLESSPAFGATLADRERLMYQGGLKVTTTLDYNLQLAAEQALQQVLPNPTDPEAAIVAIDPQNGDVRTLTEKKDGGYRDNGFALPLLASRNSGSTIKPFTLATALEHGYSADQTVYAPQVFTLPGYTLHNAEPAVSSYYTLRTALWYSINTVYGPLAIKLGLRHVFDLAQAAGLRSGTNDFAQPYASKAIGVEITPISEAVAFSTLMDHGVRHDPRYLQNVTSNAGPVYTAPVSPAGVRVLPASVADTVVDVMQGVVQYGTGTAAAQPFPVYGKTGTTDNYENAWFTGCTPTVCITVWMGYDTPRPMRGVEGVPGGVFGGTLPAQIFAHIWSNYRTLATPTPSPSVSPSQFQPAPVPVTSAPSPSPRISRSPRRTPRASPAPTRSASPRPTGILPPPPATSSSPSPSASQGPRRLN